MSLDHLALARAVTCSLRMEAFWHMPQSGPFNFGLREASARVLVSVTGLRAKRIAAPGYCFSES